MPFKYSPPPPLAAPLRKKKNPPNCSPGRSAGCHLVLMEIYLCVLPAGLTRRGLPVYRGGCAVPPHEGGSGRQLQRWGRAAVPRRVGNARASGLFAFQTTYFK